MALLQTKWIADDAVNDLKVKLRNDQALRSRNAADTADVEVIKLNASDEVILPAGTKIGANSIATLNDIPTTFRLQGNWNANTNTPTLASGVNPIAPLEFPMYIVEVAGSTTLDGYTDWVVGDKVYFTNGQWYKADNNDAVTSVNSQTGVVVLDSDDIAEGVTNLYFTEARVLATDLAGYVVGANTALTGTDTVLGAFEKVQGQINALASSSANFQTEVITLAAGDITNQFVTLANQPVAGSLVVFVKGSLPQVQGDDFEVDAVNLDQVNFLGDLAANAIAGDKLVITYSY